MRSGTSIGANVKEAEQAQSKADFLSKMNIALKEALKKTCEELISILVKIVVTTKKSLGR